MAYEERCRSCIENFELLSLHGQNPDEMIGPFMKAKPVAEGTSKTKAKMPKHK